MVKVSTRNLKDQLSSYLHRAEGGERILVLRGGKPVAVLLPLDDLPTSEVEGRLAALESRGLVVRPSRPKTPMPRRPIAPARGPKASSMVIEDRR